MIDQHHGWNRSFKPVIIGFVLTILLLVAAYRFVIKLHLTDEALTIALFGLAIAQVIILFIFFFHLGVESKPRWNLMTFLFTMLIVLIVVGGSMWIMHNLDYNIMVHLQ